MDLTSLDPRIIRLHIPADMAAITAKPGLDQLITFEVFVLKRDNTLYTYVGPVHAPDLEVAFVFAKEQYSRRATCSGLWVVKTQDIQVTPYVNDNESIWQTLLTPNPDAAPGPSEAYAIFTLKKRGKAHAYAGTVRAPDNTTALAGAKALFAAEGPCVNIWMVPESKILKSSEEDKELWLTLNEKKYREPMAYKVLEKINAYKNRTSANT